MKRVQGFYDANFLLATSKGRLFLKVYGHDALPAIQFQTSLIELLYKAKLPVGKLLRTVENDPYFKFKKTHGIVQKFLQGKHLDDSRVDAKLLSHIGAMLGKFDRITQHASFEGEKWKKYGWDLAQFDIPASRLPKLRRLLPKKVFKLSSAVVSEWRKERSQLNKLRKGVIHRFPWKQCFGKRPCLFRYSGLRRCHVFLVCCRCSSSTRAPVLFAARQSTAVFSASPQGIYKVFYALRNRKEVFAASHPDARVSYHGGASVFEEDPVHVREKVLQRRCVYAGLLCRPKK